jgi:hypothetical protein
VGFLDALLGRTRLPKPNEDRVFAMSTAVITLEAAGLRPGGRLGIVLKRLPPGRFEQLESEVRQLLSLEDDRPRTAVELKRDDLGFDWLVLSGTDFQESLAAAHMVATRFLEEGLGDLLLACLFRFEQGGRAAYWVYGYKLGTFYPFLPTGDRRRDNAEELRLAAVAKGELPIEPDLAQWYPLWGPPL